MEEFLNKYNVSVLDNALITSDLHLGHERVIKFEPIREELRKQDNFDGTPDEYIIHKWNEQVKPDDFVINLGDLHWKSFEPFANKLNGIMILVLGNHDRPAQYYKKFNNIFVCSGVWNLDGNPSQYYIEPENQDKLLSGFIYKNTMFSHYPVRNLEHEYNYQSGGKIIERMKTLFKFTLDKFNIHGHLHSSKKEQEENDYNVCFDFNKYKLLKLKDILRKS